MNNVFLVIIFALIFACVVALIAKSYDLSLSERRLIFALSIILGAFLYMAAINLFYLCDQGGCGYQWGNPLSKG